MEIKALLMDPADNVVTCIKPVQSGDVVAYADGEVIKTVQAVEDIPFCHKIALKDFSENDKILKYGEMIGKASCRIPAGGWVSEKNIRSEQRDYRSEYIRDN